MRIVKFFKEQPCFFLSHPHLILFPYPPFLSAGTTASSTAGAMNSLTSLGTLQGLAGATVGLNNINALAGSINSEYSPCHRPFHPLTSPHTFSSRLTPQPQPVSRRRETRHCIRGQLIWVYAYKFF